MVLGVVDVNPRYLGRTPGGMPLYVCRDLFSSPPFPIVACSNSFTCNHVGNTY
ncbi:MAG: hypothetical protein ACKOXO_13025 [Cyanobium sp.]